jgi:hypothetical protein
MEGTQQTPTTNKRTTEDRRTLDFNSELLSDLAKEQDRLTKAVASLHPGNHEMVFGNSVEVRLATLLVKGGSAHFEWNEKKAIKKALVRAKKERKEWGARGHTLTKVLKELWKKPHDPSYAFELRAPQRAPEYGGCSDEEEDSDHCGSTIPSSNASQAGGEQGTEEKKEATEKIKERAGCARMAVASASSSTTPANDASQTNGGQETEEKKEAGTKETGAGTGGKAAASKKNGRALGGAAADPS